MASLFINSCHTHIALVLNIIQYKGRRKWRVNDVLKMLCTESRYFAWSGVVEVYWLYLTILLGLLAYAVVKGRLLVDGATALG